MDRSEESLAKRVKQMRLRRGLTQGALARAAGLKQPDVSKIELGLIEKTTAIARLAAALQVSVAWLELGVGASDEGEREPSSRAGSTLALEDQAEIQLILDLRALLPDDRERILREASAKANEMRRHAEFLLRTAAVQGSAPRPSYASPEPTPMAPAHPGPSPSTGR